MDLSTTAKNKRDAVEEPLFRLSNLIDSLEEIRTRINAAVKVWPEISRTLSPALHKLDIIINDLRSLKSAIAVLWQQGFDVKWKL